MIAALRLKDVAAINVKSLPESTPPDFAFRYIDIGAVTEGRVAMPEHEVAFANAPSRARRLADPGDTIISTVRTYLRAVARVPDSESPLVFSTGFAVLHAAPSVDPRFLAYYCRSKVFIDEVVARSVGMSYPAINSGDLGDIRLSVPELEEQRRIADFLDAQVARSRRLDTLHETQIALLAERIDSGIGQKIIEAGLGVVAASRPLTPLRRILIKLARPPVVGEMVTAFRDGQVTARVLRRTEGFTESWTTDSVVQGVRVGDIVIHGLDGFSGAVGVAEADGVCSPAYHVCQPVPGHDVEYLGRMLRILAIGGYLSSFGGSARERAVDFRNWKSFSAASVPLVPFNEQRDIGRMIGSLKRIRSGVERALVFRQERTEALITSAVMGQLDPTTARGAA